MDILTVSDLDCVDKAAIQVFGLLLDVLSVCSEAYTHTHTHTFLGCMCLITVATGSCSKCLFLFLPHAGQLLLLHTHPD